MIFIPKIKSTSLIILVILMIFSINISNGQSPGDTIKIQAFQYSSTHRDTLINFPDNNLSYEKIIMKYNMRCKGGLVSTGSDRNRGCGEWDYSCNTFIVDSSKIEIVNSTHPKYIISGFDGDEFNYTTEILHDYYQYKLTDVGLNNIISEEQYEIGHGEDIANLCIDGSQPSGKTQFLYHAEELLDSGLQAGTMDGILMNVSNQGGDVNFLKLSINEVEIDLLDPNSPVLTGFQEVYNNHYKFQNGENRIQFLSPFEWNGTSNLLIELSYTNSAAQNSIEFTGVSKDEVLAIYTNNNNSADFSKGGYIDINATNLSSIEKELTVSFWTFGDDDLLPANTSIIWANGEVKANRSLNIHLPWENGSIYFDCGYDGGFDRIDKTASPNNYKGQWNHWAFTKNATTGIMQIYLNGSFFASGSGKIKNIEIMEMILGADYRHLLNYKGQINEFRVWDTVLSSDQINNWMNISVNESHPQYDHLVAYYAIDEGHGQIVTDHKNSSVSTGTKLFWSYERGVNLSRNFKVSDIRPQISVLRGSYDITLTPVTTIDSIKRTPSAVDSYVISSNEGQAKHDEVSIDSTYFLFESKDINTYDGESGDLLSTETVEHEGSLVQVDLDYVRRFPFYNEIMSFVTPYGIGLDFGKNGKSWYFDVTDFGPILKGEKGFLMTNGGQWQEEFDIEFWFIVGTPPRDVIAFDQIWQGVHRIGSANILDIYNDNKIKSVDVDIHPEAKAFKIRSTVTGHGSEGEFQQNGGSVLHSIAINGEEESYFDLHKECSENPIFPQGGTWVIDRQGWCPGERSILNEFDATEYIVPGSTTAIDYKITYPQKTNGDYRYLMAHQLISYGEANRSLDAGVVDVLIPSDNVLYSRYNPSCVNPTIIIQNTGATTLTGLNIEYWINDNNNIETYHWSGSLDFLEKETVELPIGSCFDNADQEKNIFHISIEKPNNGSDEYPNNNSYNSNFTMPDVLPEEFILEVKTNNKPNENSLKIRDFDGNIILTNSLSGANTTHQDTIRLSGCYSLEVRDSGNDGIQWWANPGQGSGYIRLKNMDGTTIKTLEPDFGGRMTYGFSTNGITAVKDEMIINQDIMIAPNPSTGVFTIEGQNLANMNVVLYDIFGHIVAWPIVKHDNMVRFDVRSINSGIYFVSIIDGDQQLGKKVIVH